MGNETINNKYPYGYAVRDAVSVTWLTGVKTLTAAKRAATHREAAGAELRVYRIDDATGEHFIVSTRRDGKWVDKIV